MEMHEKFTQAAFALLLKAFLEQNMRTKVRYCLFLQGSESYLNLDHYMGGKTSKRVQERFCALP